MQKQTHRARWQNQVLAESDQCLQVEGNWYFPPDSIQKAFFKPNDKTTYCNWKGTAWYYDVVVGEAVDPAAAWYYPEPLPAARKIKNYVAFGGTVDVT